MLNLDSLTVVAKGNISLHFIPSIDCLEIMVHLIPSSINGIRRLVSLLKYLILQLIDIRHTYPFFVPQYTLVIFRKSGRLLFLNITLYLIDLLVFQLTFPNP
jgi:hypothetical protein